MSIRCRILHLHAWSDWDPDYFPVLREPVSESRVCDRCGYVENRPAARPSVAVDGELVTLPPPIPVPIYEVPEPVAEAGRWQPRYEPAELAELPPVGAPPWLTALTESPFSMLAAPRGVVVNRDLIDAADSTPSPFVAAPGSPESELAATRQMLVDLARQLDEVTIERDELRRERELDGERELVPGASEVGIPKDILDAARYANAIAARLHIALYHLEQFGAKPDLIARLAPPKVRDGLTPVRPESPRHDRC